MTINGQPRIAVLTQGYFTAGGVQTVARSFVKVLRGLGATVEVHNVAQSRSDPLSRRLAVPSTWRLRSLRSEAKESGVFQWGANCVELEPFRYVPRLELTEALSSYDLIQIVSGSPLLALTTLDVQRPRVLQVATRVGWERGSATCQGISGPRFLRACNTRVLGLAEGWALRSVDAVLVENDALHCEVRRLGQASVTKLPPSVDINKYVPAGTSRDQYCVSVARLGDKRKGLPRLVRSYRLLAEQMGISTPRLILAGRGEPSRELVAEVDKSGVQTAIEILPDVSAQDLPILHRRGLCYVQTSYEEGLGISMLEAMASGQPVVASDTAGARECFGREACGIIVPEAGTGSFEFRFARAWRSVLEAPDDYALSSRRRVTAEFSESVFVERLKALYRSLGVELTGSHQQPI